MAPTWLAGAAAAFAGSLVSGVAGFGGAAVFLPVVAALYGVRASVPIVTLAVLLGNASRAWFYRRHLRWRIIALFCLGAVPAAWLGSEAYVRLPADAVRRAIGLFLVASVAWRRLRRPWTFSDDRLFLPLGAVSAFLSAVVGAVGPFTAPFFLAYGLVKEAYVGSEALCAAATHLTKAIAYRRLAVLGTQELALGVSFGLVMAAGSWVAKLVMERLPRERFLLLVEVLLVVEGAAMVLRP